MEVKAIQSYQLGPYEKAMPSPLSWSDKLRETKNAGFDYLEMSIDESDEKLARLSMPKEDRLRLVEEIYQSGVPIRSICLSCHRKYPFGSHDESQRKRSLEIMEKAIDLAGDLGVRLIQLAGYDVYYEQGDRQTRALFLHNLRIAVEMAEQRGVPLGFETMETPFMDTVAKAMNYVREINSPYLGVYPDIGNLTNTSFLYSKPVVNDLEAGAGHILAAHLKETAVGRYREVPYGAGHTDFYSSINKLKDLGVRMFVGEFWYLEGTQWRDDLHDANRFLRKYLDNSFRDTNGE